ncbi:MAG: hypothetical protein QM813_21190 [Verrucomicrobiota bacterium]
MNCFPIFLQSSKGWRRVNPTSWLNAYTRGQIHLFIAAHHRYGLMDIVDWMISGDDPLLLESDLARIRRLVAPSPVANLVAKATNSVVEPRTNAPAVTTPPTLPSRLVLQGITWSNTRPLATINGRNFGVNDEAKISLSDGTVTVRCVEIQPRAVVLQTNGIVTPLRLELKLE